MLYKSQKPQQIQIRVEFKVILIMPYSERNAVEQFSKKKKITIIYFTKNNDLYNLTAFIIKKKV